MTGAKVADLSLNQSARAYAAISTWSSRKRHDEPRSHRSISTPASCGQ